MICCGDQQAVHVFEKMGKLSIAIVGVARLKERTDGVRINPAVGEILECLTSS